MKAWQGSLGVSAYSGIVSPAYFVYKAVGSLDRHFAHYLLRSGGYAQHMAAISAGIRPNQWDLASIFHDGPDRGLSAPVASMLV